MQPGERCICQSGSWTNAFGAKNEELHTGMRLRVKRAVNLAGAVFYEFEETEPGNLFWGAGFKPMRQLN